MKYDWAIVGGGIAGIATAEILTRNGLKVALIEKDEKLAGQTTKDFHEWIHTGCLYTLLSDQFLTMKYMLGAIDDLFDYYSSFERMNLAPTESGLSVDKEGWFIPNYIHFKFKQHRFNPIWLLITAQSLYFIKKIASHDWLRRRAGILEEYKAKKLQTVIKLLYRIWTAPEEFYSIKTSDLTTNSRLLLRDLVATGIENGLDLYLGQAVNEIRTTGDIKTIVTDKETIAANGIILCAGKNVADFVDVKVKTSYAPMAIVNGLDDDSYSFVELDYRVKKCINLLVKDPGVGQIGGISLKKREDCDQYLDYVIARHRAYQPNLNVVGRYIGFKNEVTFPNQNRNYQFHIVDCENNVWACIPGKFTLAFSLAPELYRRIYKKNSIKHFKSTVDTGQATNYVSDTRWQEIINKDESVNSHGLRSKDYANLSEAPFLQDSDTNSNNTAQNLALSDGAE